MPEEQEKIRKITLPGAQVIGGGVRGDTTTSPVTDNSQNISPPSQPVIRKITLPGAQVIGGGVRGDTTVAPENNTPWYETAGNLAGHTASGVIKGGASILDLINPGYEPGMYEYPNPFYNTARQAGDTTAKTIANGLDLPDVNNKIKAREYVNNILPQPTTTGQKVAEAVGENAIYGAPFGPTGIISNAVAGGTTEFLNDTTTSPRIANDIMGMVAGLFTPIKSLSRIPKLIGEGLGISEPNEIVKAWQATGQTSHTAAGIGEDNSFIRTVRALRESPFSDSINKTEAQGKEQLEKFFNEHADDITKAQAGETVQSALGNPMDRNSGGWVNLAQTNLASREEKLDEFVNPKTTQVPVVDLFKSIRDIATPPEGAFSLNPKSESILDDFRNTIIKYNYPEANDYFVPLSNKFITSPKTPEFILNYLAESNTNTLPLEAVRYLKRGIGDQLSNSMFAMSNLPYRELKLIWNKLSDTEALAYRGTPYEAEFNSIKEDWNKYFTQREQIKKLLDHSVGPGVTLERLLSEVNKDGSKLQKVFAVAPQARADVANYVVRQMGINPNTDAFDPNLFFKNWTNQKKLTPEARAQLFRGDTADLPALYDQLAIASREQARSEGARNYSGTTGTATILGALKSVATIGVVGGTAGAGLGATYSLNVGDNDIYNDTKWGGISGALIAYGLGPKLLTFPPFVRLMATNPTVPEATKKLKALSMLAPQLAPELMMVAHNLNNQTVNMTPSMNSQTIQGATPKYMGGGYADPAPNNPNAYAGGGPTARWNTMSEGYAEGGLLDAIQRDLYETPPDATEKRIAEDAEKGKRPNPDNTPKPFAMGGEVGGIWPTSGGPISYANGGLSILDRILDAHVKLYSDMYNYYINPPKGIQDSDLLNMPRDIQFGTYDKNNIVPPPNRTEPEIDSWFSGKAPWEDPDPNTHNVPIVPNSYQLAQGGIAHNTDDPRPFYNPQLPRVNAGGWAGGGPVTNSEIGGFAAGGDVSSNIIASESGGNPNAKNPKSSASGLGQFIDSTWISLIKKYHPDISNPLAVKNDPALQREMIDKYANENMDMLQKNGVQITPGNVYLAHFLGPAGAVAFNKADPNQPASSVIASYAPRMVNKILEANPFLRRMTVAQVMALMDKKMGGTTVASNTSTVTNNTSSTPFDEQEPEISQVEAEEEQDQLEEPKRNAVIDYLMENTPDSIHEAIKRIASTANIKTAEDEINV